MNDLAQVVQQREDEAIPAFEQAIQVYSDILDRQSLTMENTE